MGQTSSLPRNEWKEEIGIIGLVVIAIALVLKGIDAGLVAACITAIGTIAGYRAGKKHSSM